MRDPVCLPANGIVLNDEVGRAARALHAKNPRASQIECALIVAEEVVQTEVERLRGLLTEVAQSGVAFADPRLRYTEVQIDADIWDALVAEFTGEEG